MDLSNTSIQTGHSLEITGFRGLNIVRERLHEMGLRIGISVVVIGRAPFGGPVLIRFQTSFLALRMEEAACVEVELNADLNEKINAKLLGTGEAHR